MADLLVRAFSSTNPDPDKDMSGCYKEGDIVGIQPTGWPWGDAERDRAKFKLVTLTGPDGLTPLWGLPKGWQPGDDVGAMPPEIEKYLAYQLDAEGRPIRRRVWGVAVNSPGIPATPEVDRTVTHEDAKQFIVNKENGLSDADGGL